MNAKTSLFLIAAVLASACKKNTGNTPQPSVWGTWELRATKGGNILPAVYPAGNGNLVKFTQGSYAAYSSGSLVTQGTYQSSSDSNTETLTFKSGNFTSETGTVLLDTLKIKPFNPEIATSYYVKIP